MTFSNVFRYIILPTMGTLALTELIHQCRWLFRWMWETLMEKDGGVEL